MKSDNRFEGYANARQFEAAKRERGRVTRRTDSVLAELAREGYISEDEIEAAAPSIRRALSNV